MALPKDKSIKEPAIVFEEEDISQYDSRRLSEQHIDPNDPDKFLFDHLKSGVPLSFLPPLDDWQKAILSDFYFPPKGTPGGPIGRIDGKPTDPKNTYVFEGTKEEVENRFSPKALEAAGFTKTVGADGSTIYALGERTVTFSTRDGRSTYSDNDLSAEIARRYPQVLAGPTYVGDAPDFSRGGALRYDTSIPASVRHNNPGATYPAGWMRMYGMNGVDTIGGGHLIANFPDAISGAAANLHLAHKIYAGKTLSEYIAKWSGNNASDGYAQHVAKALGITTGTVITGAMIRDANFMPRMLAAQSEWEAGHGPKGEGRAFRLTPEQWNAAHTKFMLANGFAVASAEATTVPPVAHGPDFKPLVVGTASPTSGGTPKPDVVTTSTPPKAPAAGLLT